MKIEIDITGCRDCICLKQEEDYGNFGRKSQQCFIAKKGAFGVKGEYYHDIYKM